MLVKKNFKEELNIILHHTSKQKHLKIKQNICIFNK